ncbi:hypothetical protein B484DRAFT_410654 [Ochromonadaceae sp. CCMP2298]|nr:hypothetical protein B484DRAFT_410654 [Ochromonadaceae sp. CCMP2298]
MKQGEEADPAAPAAKKLTKKQHKQALLDTYRKTRWPGSKGEIEGAVEMTVMGGAGGGGGGGGGVHYVY